jgi:steroid 5-alpha reductase family enzyme
MLSPGVQIVVGLVAAAAGMAALWAVHLRTRNAGLVDVGWAGGTGVLGVFFAATSPGYVPRRVILALMVGLWSLRLTTYLLRDRILGKPEEGRYRTLREHWGEKANRKLFFFFQAQAVLALLFALPVLVASRHPLEGVRLWDGLALAVWIVGLGGIAMADRQLERFKREPANRGKTCREGLWRYSRHPNYFFEWIHWWSYAAAAAGAPFWWVAVLLPIVLLFFILKVTGIPPTEAQALASRGDDYRRYQQTTSAFVPWFPRREDPSP